MSEGGDFIVAAAYMPYDSPGPPPGPSFIRLVEFCEAEGIPMIIGADSNSHHKIWDSLDINKRGEELIQYLASMDLMIANRGRKATFKNAVSKSYGNQENNIRM